MKKATSKSAALVLIHDEEPTEQVKKLCEYYTTQLERVDVIKKAGGTTTRGVDQSGHYSQVVRSRVGWLAKPRRVVSKRVSGG